MFSRCTTIFILDGFRSAYNVGSVFRTAEAVKPSAVFPCGISALPGGRKVGRTSRGTHASVPWIWFPDAVQASLWAMNAGFGVVAVENSPGAVPLNRADLPPGTAFILGNEAEGISEQACALAQWAVMIPQQGDRRCLNVASVAAMVGWEVLRRRLSGCSPGS